MVIGAVYMRIRVLLDDRKPLKRRMKIKKEGGDWSWISFKYERITTFCFYCGILEHSEFFCEKFLDQADKAAPKPYGLFMKALNRRPQNNAGEKWLRYDSPVMETSGGTNAENCMVVDSIKPTIEAQIQESNSSGVRLSSGTCMNGVDGGGNGGIRNTTGQVNKDSPSKSTTNCDQLDGVIVIDQRRSINDGAVEDFMVTGLEREREVYELGQVSSKNLLAAGPVAQAHRDQ